MGGITTYIEKTISLSYWLKSPNQSLTIKFKDFEEFLYSLKTFQTPQRPTLFKFEDFKEIERPLRTLLQEVRENTTEKTSANQKSSVFFIENNYSA